MVDGLNEMVRIIKDGLILETDAKESTKGGRNRNEAEVRHWTESWKAIKLTR